MSNNKRHNVLDDVWDYPFWNAQHVTRTSLAINTLDVATPVIISEDQLEILKMQDVKVATPALKEQTIDKPVVLQFDGHRDSGGRFIILVLCVYNKDTGELECYPFSNNNQDNKFWPYDLRFFIGGPSSDAPYIRKGNFHPAAAGEKLSEPANLHMASLASIVMGFFKQRALGLLTIAEKPENHTKINKKRLKAKKATITSDWVVKFTN